MTADLPRVLEPRLLEPSHPEWHDHLESIAPAPPVKELFVHGRALPDPLRSVAIVGTRRPTVTGLELAHAFAKALAEAGYAIISGLALGIDAAAHRGALEAGGHTVAVLGCGLDVPYLERNKLLRCQIAESGTLVSEYPAGTEPKPWRFPARNRIIVGLAERVLIIEGGLNSGALITARIAVDAGRDTFALPGSPRNAVAIGPNELIRRGEAAIVTAPEHLFEAFAAADTWDEPYEPGDRILLAEPEAKVLHALDAVGVTATEVGRAVAMKPGQAMLNLTKLEMRGLARRNRSGRYEITEAGHRVSATTA